MEERNRKFVLINEKEIVFKFKEAIPNLKWVIFFMDLYTLLIM